MLPIIDTDTDPNRWIPMLKAGWEAVSAILMIWDLAALWESESARGVIARAGAESWAWVKGNGESVEKVWRGRGGGLGAALERRTLM